MNIVVSVVCGLAAAYFAYAFVLCSIRVSLAAPSTGEPETATAMALLACASALFTIAARIG